MRQFANASFARRDAATKELCKENESALPLVRETLKSAQSLEHRRRIEAVIDHLRTGNETPGSIRAGLQELRALEVLERIGTADARKIVERIAGGADAIMTFEAQLILSRWR